MRKIKYHDFQPNIAISALLCYTLYWIIAQEGRFDDIQL